MLILPFCKLKQGLSIAQTIISLPFSFTEEHLPFRLLWLYLFEEILGSGVSSTFVIFRRLTYVWLIFAA